MGDIGAVLVLWVVSEGIPNEAQVAEVLLLAVPLETMGS